MLRQKFKSSVRYFLVAFSVRAPFQRVKVSEEIGKMSGCCRVSDSFYIHVHQCKKNDGRHKMATWTYGSVSSVVLSSLLQDLFSEERLH